MLLFLFLSQKGNGLGVLVLDYGIRPEHNTLLWTPGCRWRHEATCVWWNILGPQNECTKHLDFDDKTPGFYTLLFLFEQWVVSEGLWADWSSKRRLPREQKCIVKSVCEAFGLSTFEASDSQELGRENWFCLRFLCVLVFFKAFSRILLNMWNQTHVNFNLHNESRVSSNNFTCRWLGVSLTAQRTYRTTLTHRVLHTTPRTRQSAIVLCSAIVPFQMASGMFFAYGCRWHAWKVYMVLVYPKRCHAMNCE